MPSARDQQRQRAAELDEQWRWPADVGNVCPDCGGTFFNKWAHAEECSGVSARLICRKIVTTLPVTRCVLDDGHAGACKGERGA